MDENCSKLFLKCFWTALSTWADSETNLFNCTTVHLHLGGCSKLHPPFFQIFSIQHGEQKRPADSTLTEEGTVAGNSQTVPGASCQVRNLAQGWLNALGVPDLSGTLRKGTKEHCQQDVKTSKIVNLALDTWETQMCCLHKKTAHKWQWLVTKQKPCPCCHLQCCGSLCTSMSDLPGERFALLYLPQQQVRKCKKWQVCFIPSGEMSRWLTGSSNV